MTCNHWSEILCKHWKELDDDVSSCFEYRKAKRARCSCCGVRKQCSYPNYFNASQAEVEMLQSRDRIDNTRAMIGL